MGDVKYLLDTHTLLWMAQDEVKLGKNALDIVGNIDNQLFVSSVSVYEITYKHQIGKLAGYEYFVKNFFDIIKKLDLKELPLDIRHAHFAGSLKWQHRDPFDRLLAAQAAVDELVLLTNDAAFDEMSGVAVVW